MKVDIDTNGILCILAETTVESFALTHWYEGWQKDNCTFLIQCVNTGNGKLESKLEVVKNDKKRDLL